LPDVVGVGGVDKRPAVLQLAQAGLDDRRITGHEYQRHFGSGCDTLYGRGEGSRVAGVVLNGYGVKGEVDADALNGVFSYLGNRRVHFLGCLGRLYPDGQRGGVEKGLLVAEEYCLVAHRKGPIAGTHGNKLDRGTCGGGQTLRRFVRDIRAIRELHTFLRELHGEGQTCRETALFTVGLRQQFVNL
jgi:hypothetical protein